MGVPQARQNLARAGFSSPQTAHATIPGVYGPGCIPRTASSTMSAGCGSCLRRSTRRGWRDGHAWWVEQGLGDAVRHARRLGLWVAMATQAGATQDEDFPGLAALVSPSGEVVRLPDWRPGTLAVEVPM
jgi:hypothetical protein